jgi:hypothetical protein
MQAIDIRDSQIVLFWDETLELGLEISSFHLLRPMVNKL